MNTEMRKLEIAVWETNLIKIHFQIMKQIFQGLVALQLHTSWQEIFEFRETHIGNFPSIRNIFAVYFASKKN